MAVMHILNKQMFQIWNVAWIQMFLFTANNACKKISKSSEYMSNKSYCFLSISTGLVKHS